MFYNNLKIAFRTLFKNKVYTVINIIGLMVGIAAVLLIYRIVSYEQSFNKNFPNYEKIVRVVSTDPGDVGGQSETSCVPIPAKLAIRSDITQLAAVARIREYWPTFTVMNKDETIPKKKFSSLNGEISFFADPEFVDIFSITSLAGDLKTGLTAPDQVLLSQGLATKLFDNWEVAVGNTVRFDHIRPMMVKGVFADLPDNSDFPLSALVSYKTLEAHDEEFYHAGPEAWNSCSSNNQVYALLNDINQWDEINTQLATIGQDHYNATPNGQKRSHHLQSLSTLHFHETLGNSGRSTSSADRLQIMSLVGLLILLIACFNFINLATAQATQRAKEVGVRKTLGGRPIQLIGQFMSETGLIVLTAIILGVMLAEFTLPWLKYISDVPTDISLLVLADSNILTFIVLVFFGVTFFAGLYPAFVLSSYRPVEALSRTIKTKSLGGLNLQKTLVVAQFVVSSILIIGTIITVQQLNYIQSRDLGFNKDLIYTFFVNNDSTSLTKHATLINQLTALPGVEAVSMNSDLPLSDNTWSGDFRIEGRPEDEPYETSFKFTDENYLRTFGLEMVAGRWLNPSDTVREVIVNETFLKKANLGTPEEALHKKIRMHGMFRPVVGVVKDFHTHSLHTPHQPLMIGSRKNFFWVAGVKLNHTALASSLTGIQRVFDQVYPEQVLEGRFLDERIQEYYENEQQISAICKGFGLLAIFISCLGLLGLAMHAAARRTKEIGVRKVLGASVQNIITLLSKDFIWLVVLALVIASPIAWYTMNKWLNGFAYRIDIQWWIFLVAGTVAVLVAFITVGIQGFRAAVADPIKALRDE